jgi:hypothetical protein
MKLTIQQVDELREIHRLMRAVDAVIALARPSATDRATLTELESRISSRLTALFYEVTGHDARISWNIRP